MDFRVTARRAQPDTADAPLLVLALASGATLTPVLTALDATLGGALGRALERKDFRGARDETLVLPGAAKGAQHVLLVGLGKPASMVGALRRAASVASRQARKIGAPSLAFFAEDQSEGAIEAVAVGLTMGSWEYTTTRSAPPEDERKPALESAQILVSDEASANAAVQRGSAIGGGINLARQLAMLPGNICTPEYLANTAREIASRRGMNITVLGRTEMKAEKMGSFLAVAQGTPQDPKLIALEYKKGPAGSKPVVLIGKGLCFDSGGISIKPAQGMEHMKFDMCGAAGVLGAMDTIGALGLPINVVGLVGSTTNMPSGEAMNPGDVVQSHLGKFIEIVNTDAEGRLVLADVLSYARRFDPAAVIDAATLTGACVVALGHSASGVFGNDQALIDEVLAAGRSSGDTGWQLPLFDDYKELILTDAADIKNTGGRAAGAISAAMFLKEFAETFPWVHLDIAGTAYSETDLGFIPKGPTGVPVSLFVDFVRGRAH
ncbi:MAG TPA: leucyl aminopeptidase [Gemmatimonadaceae bacterium]|nr:leucyl aminopeptidase [Gemmatimonadaceae bacterium]